MVVQGNRCKRLIYVFEFSDNSCYVGLTCNIKRRKTQHLIRDRKSTVFKHIIMTKTTPTLIIKSEYLNTDNAIKLEESILMDYRIRGWEILNKVKTGNLGSNITKWNKENCKEESLKYKTISEYQRLSKSSYNSALKNNWIDCVCSHMVRGKFKNGYWNDRELCEVESLKYKTISELHKNNWSAYNYSKINGWLYDFFKK